MKLHIGCGKRSIPGWTQIDIESRPHVDIVCDARTLPFDTNSAEIIYSCQVIGYFEREELQRVLMEWVRVLRLGGILRLSVTNFETIVKLYTAGLSLDWFYGSLYGPITAGGQRLIYRMVFDKHTLTKLMYESGLKRVEPWDWRHTEHAHVDDFSQAYFPHMEKDSGILWNLNLQGWK